MKEYSRKKYKNVENRKLKFKNKIKNKRNNRKSRNQQQTLKSNDQITAPNKLKMYT